MEKNEEIEGIEVDQELQSENAKTAQLNNQLLKIQIESEQMELKRKQEVDSMINDFLGYGNNV